MNKKLKVVAVMLLAVATLVACTSDVLQPVTDEKTQLTDTHKRIALLSMLADINYDIVAASEQELIDNTLKINETLQSNADVKAFIGTDWQVVWGPAISNSIKKSTTMAVDSFVTDNTMYVAKGTDLSTGKPIHVVAIAGTNAVSRKGAIVEDLNIVTEKAWGVSGSGKISAGSEAGFKILNAMTDPVTGKTLLEFLSMLNEDGPGEIAFTGHSLGGALSPLMALKFIELKKQMGYNNLSVSIYPIAGPTPGNKDFAEYAAGQFGDGYHSVINSNDIVPHAWQKDMFAKIPSMYKNVPPFNPGGNKGFSLPLKEQLDYDALKLVIDFQTYQRIAPEKEFVFEGKANIYPDGSGTFFKEAKYQHTIAYYKDAFEFPEAIILALSN